MGGELTEEIYNQLLSISDEEVLQGIEAAYTNNLLTQEPIHTALVCLGFFRFALVTKAIDQGFLPADFLDETSNADTRHDAFIALLKHMANSYANEAKTGIVLQSIKQHCHDLKEFIFDYDQFDQLPSRFVTPEGLPSLEKVVLKNVTTIPAFVCALTHIKQLNVAHNKLETIPKTIGKLTQLEVLDLTNNTIKELPKELDKLQQLRELNLSHNRLQQLPENIGKLPELTLINVGFNRLLSLPQRLNRDHITLLGWANPYIKISSKIAAKLALDYAKRQPDDSLGKYTDRQLNSYALFLYVFGRQYSMALPLPYEIIEHLKIPAQYNEFEKLAILEQELTGLPEHFDYNFLKHTLVYKQVIETAIKQKFLVSGKPLFARLVFSTMSQARVKRIRVTSPLLAYVQELPHKDLKFAENWLYPENIKHLDLSNLELESVPAWVVKYHRLEELNLSSNQLSYITEDLAQLHELKKLWLHNNQLTHLPSQPSPQLNYINLHNNALTHIPANWLNQPSLEVWNLSHNKIARLPKNNWQQLASLQKLDLSYNALTVLRQEIVNLPKAKHLFLEHNKLIEIPEELVDRQIVSLRDFISNFCDIPEKLGNKYGHLVDIYRLVLDQYTEKYGIAGLTNVFCLAHFNSSENVRKASLKELKRWFDKKQSKALKLWEYTDKPSYPQFLSFLYEAQQILAEQLSWECIAVWVKRLSLHSSKRVLMSNQQVKGLPDFALKYWQNPWVDLSYNELKKLPKTLAHILNISRLDLSYNLLKQFDNKEALYMTQIKKLYLNDNFLKSVPPALFAELPRVTNIDLSHNYLGELPEFSYAPKLKKLDLSHNLLTYLPTSITQFHSLQHLNLSHNHLGLLSHLIEPALPLEMSHLDRLTHLDLSYNFLDEIPPGIGLMDNLQWLNLSQNRLTELPVLYDSLTLEVLDLSHNELTQVSADITEIPTLQKIILTGNPLQPHELYLLKRRLPQVNIVFDDALVNAQPPPTTQHYLPETESEYNTGKEYYLKKKYKKAKYYFRQAALDHHLEAMYTLGMIFSGESQKTYWWHRAAKQGHLEAQENLANYHYRNNNLAKARHWYSQAKAQGSLVVANQASEMLTGKKVDKLQAKLGKEYIYIKGTVAYNSLISNKIHLASVSLKGTAIKVYTNKEGFFKFPKPLTSGNVLTFSFEGCISQELKITKKTTNRITIFLDLAR
jgi:Leucine-rich repeat (LRR) protein